MEKTWYLFPGQTLETTKIKDRGKALVATQEGWKKITDHLHRKEYQQELVDIDEARRKYLKDGSKEMTKNWSNSIEKVHERRIADLENKIKMREENLVKRFLELRAEQQQERERILAEISKTIYMIGEHSRPVNSALLFTEVLYERKLQQEFSKMEKEHEKIEEMKEAAVIKYNAEQEVIENKEKLRKQREINVQNGKDVMAQIKEIKEKEQKEREERTKIEIVDHKRAIEEMEAIKKYEFELDRKQKADVKKQFNDFRILQNEIKADLIKQEETEDRIIKFYEKAKCKIDEKKKAKIKEARDEELRIRAEIAKKVMAVQLSGEAEEEQRIARSLKEHEEKELVKLEKQKAYQEKLKLELELNRQEVIKRKQKEEEDKKDLKKWEMLNRFKTTEVIEKYNLDKLQRLFDEKIKYRRILDKQMAETNKADYNKICEESEIKLIKDKLDADDKAFFAYAQEVYDLAKSRGRSTFPIERVIHNYKKENNLLPIKKNLSNLKSNVPLGTENKKKRN